MKYQDAKKLHDKDKIKLKEYYQQGTVIGHPKVNKERHIVFINVLSEDGKLIKSIAHMDFE